MAKKIDKYDRVKSYLETLDKAAQHQSIAKIGEDSMGFRLGYSLSSVEQILVQLNLSTAQLKILEEDKRFYEKVLAL
jgi:hypothetical protein